MLVIEPEMITSKTGVMLFTHGWHGNRFQHKEKMEWAAERFDLVTVSVEFRQSGYDFDPVKGLGACLPYDAGFYQVFDVLNGLRHILSQRPQVNHRRVFHYGGSQGGQIALLSALYAPKTFAWLYVSCPLTHIDAKFQALSGRYFAPWELEVRSPLEMAEGIPCPVYLEYGTVDPTVPHESHGLVLADKLTKSGQLARLIEYEGDHGLQPATDKLAAFQAMSEFIEWSAEVPQCNDFEQGSLVSVPCAERTLLIDWSKKTEDHTLFQWGT